MAKKKPVEKKIETSVENAEVPKIEKKEIESSTKQSDYESHPKFSKFKK